MKTNGMTGKNSVTGSLIEYVSFCLSITPHLFGDEYEQTSNFTINLQVNKNDNGLDAIFSRFGGKLHIDSTPEGVIASHAMVMKGEEVFISFQSFDCQFLVYARVSLRQRCQMV